MKTMKSIDNTLNGYMTVEAALLVPIVWFTLFFIIFAGFFQYDRCIAEQDGKIIVVRASEIKEKEKVQAIQNAIERGELAGKKKLLFSHSVQKDFRMSKDKAEIKIRGNINTVLSSLGKESKFHVFTYAAEYEAKNYDPVRFIRTCRRLESYAGS